MAKIYPSLDCNDHIVYGCESMTSGCASSQNRNNNIYPFQSSLHDFESSDDSRNVYMCYNDGECLDKLNTFYCACDLTTFQGHQCNEGKAILFQLRILWIEISLNTFNIQ